MFGLFGTANIASRVATLAKAPHKRGTSFRKSLGVYSYKLKKSQYFKKPGAVPLKQEEALKKAGKNEELVRKQKNSDRTFGTFTKKGGFRFKENLVPKLNIPNLTGFELTPYASHHT